MTTKSQFLATYRAKVAALPWAADGAKLDRFMEAVRVTIAGDFKEWDHSAPMAKAVWVELGGKSSAYSLKALRALPEA